MESRDLALLASAPLFSSIDVRELSLALTSLPHRIQSFDAGAVLLFAGSAYTELLVLLEGEVGAEMTNDEGKSFLVETIAAPGAVATAVLFAPGAILPVTVVARKAGRLVAIPRSSLLSLCTRFLPLLEALLSDMGGRLASLAEKLRAIQFASLRERLADWILRRLGLARASGAQAGGQGLGAISTIHLEASKERLASLFGVARPSLSRELGELERRGLIRVQGRSIEILDEPGLRSLRSH